MGFVDNLNQMEAINSQKKIELLVEQLLFELGENPMRSGLLKTPLRVSKMFEELLIGYKQNLDVLVNQAVFNIECSSGEIVIVDNIEFSSMCEHHMLPFQGIASVGYIPNSKIIGLSKIPRIVDMFSKRLQVQERLTHEIANAIESVLNPKGVIVYLEAEHSCAALRGVKKNGTKMKTVAALGEFKTHSDLKANFFNLIL